LIDRGAFGSFQPINVRFIGPVMCYEAQKDPNLSLLRSFRRASSSGGRYWLDVQPGTDQKAPPQMVRTTKGGFNRLLYWPRLLDWKNQTLTPNPDVIYFMPFFNRKGVGPVVLDLAGPTLNSLLRSSAYPNGDGAVHIA
jgi:hypothetical protein